MKTYNEMHPGREDDGYFYRGTYSTLVESIGNVVVQESDADYQGDTFVLFSDGHRFGFLVFGWGSCSGCDALEACDSPSAVEALRDDLAASVKWGTASEIAAYISSADERVEWYASEWHPAFAVFRTEAMTWLERLEKAAME